MSAIHSTLRTRGSAEGGVGAQQEADMGNTGKS